jgi:prepilin-type N-terminal cleavage/methylation domain-containing protein
MRRRQAFTLVELMVAMVLVLFVMVMLTQAFTAALDTFSQLKGIGDMEDRLRSAATILRRDLRAPHFEGALSLKDLFGQGTNQNSPPAHGFFRIWQGTPSLPFRRPDNGQLYIFPNGTIFPPACEGYDADGIPSVRTTDRMLHFTVILSGNTRQNFFVTDISTDSSNTLKNYLIPDYPPDTHFQVPNTYTSQVIEVAYYLVPNGDTALGTPLYTLCRRQLLAVPNNLTYNSSAYATNNQRQSGTMPGLLDIWSLPAYAEVSCQPRITSTLTIRRI